MVDWQLIITIGILVGLALAIWARISQQTILELLRDIREFVSETKENAAEKGVDITAYE